MDNLGALCRSCLFRLKILILRCVQTAFILTACIVLSISVLFQQIRHAAHLLNISFLFPPHRPIRKVFLYNSSSWGCNGGFFHILFIIGYSIIVIVGRSGELYLKLTRKFLTWTFKQTILRRLNKAAACFIL